MSVASAQDLLASLDGIGRIQGTRLLVDDATRLRGEAIDGLVDDAVFNPD